MGIPQIVNRRSSTVTSYSARRARMLRSEVSTNACMLELWRVTKARPFVMSPKNRSLPPIENKSRPLAHHNNVAPLSCLLTQDEQAGFRRVAKRKRRRLGRYRPTVDRSD